MTQGMMRIRVDGRSYGVVLTYSPDAPPVLHALSVYEKRPGEMLRKEEVRSIPLKRVIVEGVAQAVIQDEMETEAAVRCVMQAMAMPPRRTCWTTSVDALFLRRFLELSANRPDGGLHNRLGAEFGISEQRSANRATELRHRNGSGRKVPNAQRGPVAKGLPS